VGELTNAQCSVGEKRTLDCGQCGTETDFCDPTMCQWISGLCVGEGPCLPGEVDTTKASCTDADAVRTRTCGNDCQWPAFSTCQLPLGWQPLSATSLLGRAFHSAVWTGSKMLIWGGGKTSNVFGDGAAYDNANKTWKLLSTVGAPAPRRQQMSVWTGDKMLVWGGWDNNVRFNNGAAYDPVADTWTPMATSPLTARHSGAVAWSTTTHEMIVWGGCTSGWCTGVANDGATYDPALGVWTPMPAAPIAGRSDPLYVWTGSELVIWGGRNALAAPLTDGARFDPKTRIWTKFSDPAATMMDARFDAVFGTDGSGDLLVWGGRGANSYMTPNAKNNGAIYQPGVGFTAVQPSPSTLLNSMPYRYDSAGFVANGKLYVLDGIAPYADAAKAGFAAYDLSAGTWSDIDRSGAPTNPRARASVVWTGREAIFWGGLNGNECCTGYNDGAIYRP
jgi:hypothetical protein